MLKILIEISVDNLLCQIKVSLYLVPFIRKNWSEYDRANECEYENSLEPIKFNRPEDFASWTNQQFLDALVNCMTPLSGTSTVSAGIGVSQTGMLLERIFLRKVQHLFSIGAFLEKSRLKSWLFVSVFLKKFFDTPEVTKIVVQVLQSFTPSN